ncbi:unnamed protein product [Peniophora sp. CBMAI 1063]|nr:unnamed protein product [Peniophora sp. CBMAI 1063]
MLAYSVQPPPLSFRKNSSVSTRRTNDRSPLPRLNSSYFPPAPSAPPPPPASARSPSPLNSPYLSDVDEDEDGIADVLYNGDSVGPLLLGQPLRPARLPNAADLPPSPDQPPRDAEYEVVRKLGTGSYAVVYLVREVLDRPLSDDGHVGSLDMDGQTDRIVYGKEYALKLLSKANLDDEALAAQLFEATVHQSLPAHPNVVSLHRSFETDSYLCLLLEYVPGEDLFYFLEQARDHIVPPSPSPPASPSAETSRTPPTPGLLSSMHPNQLLSPVRLRLIASMFAQMCDAVQVCHDHGVFHRDIKPENFIVTDGYVEVDGRRERKVLVKLSDFGLSTTDTESGDMDCGSAPYMSYECRNNVAPTYRPRAADVWSLGIVLINMLYHCNPWTDTADGVCPSFTAFRAAPQAFLLNRFAGLTPAVASFLAERVFCILPSSGDDAIRATAREFGTWVRELPSHFAPTGVMARTASFRGHARGGSFSSLSGIDHALGSVPPSRRPISRAGSTASPRIGALSLSRAMSRAPSTGAHDAETRLAPVTTEPETIAEEEDDDQDDAQSRASTSTKRRKRGARKGKSSAVPPSPALDTSELLASASQNLARELSRASRGTGASVKSVSPSVSMSSLGVQHKQSLSKLSMGMGSALGATPVPVIPVASPIEPRTPVKKASKWKLGFGSKSSASVATEPLPQREEPASIGRAAGAGTSSRAANVSNLINGLAPAPVPVPNAKVTDEEKFRTRGRQPREREISSSSDVSSNHSNAASNFNAAFSSGQGTAFGGPRTPASSSTTSLHASGSNLEPPAQREQWSRSPVRSSAASTANSWRSSMASTNTSSSAFTRYSNYSRASVSTTATSVSAGSASGDWRSKPGLGSAASSVYSGKGKGVAPGEKRGQAHNKYPYALGVPPPNVKMMDGVPWELNELPRQLHPKPHGDIFGQPPAPRPARTRKVKGQAPLGTISESAGGARVDAGTSTTDLHEDQIGEEHGHKVQKGQINALAKMLGALRR